MKKLRKVFAVILSLAMVLGMSMTSFAANSEPAKVSGIEDGNGITVTAYQIIKYNKAGYYEEVLEGTIDKTPGGAGQQPTLNPSAENVLELYKRLDDLTTTDQFKRPTGTGDFTCSTLKPGTWLIVVSGATKNLYNPAIVSVSVTPEGNDYGTLNMAEETSWGGAIVKKSEPTITKTAKSASGEDYDANVVGTQFGDVLEFTVTASIPNYAADGKELVYIIRDTLDGLTLTQSDKAAATVNGEANNELTAAVKAAIVDGQTSFEVDSLSDDFLREFAGGKIVITYRAQVTSVKMINVDRLNNTAELEYSTNGSTEEDHQKIDTETKHYTFGIDVPVEGWKESSSTNPTGEFIKTHDENGDVNIEYTETPGEVITTKEDVKKLPGAVFELRIESANGTPFTDKSGKSEFTTDEDGRLKIAGLDDNKEYWLVETKAPEGYSINTTPVRVFIKATYETDSKTKLDDVLIGYEVQIGEGEAQAITHYNYDSTTGETEFINTPDTPSNPYEFKNTQLASLPSTGGIGTTIFTIGGCIIMVAAAGLFFASRRKSSK